MFDATFHAKAAESSSDDVASFESEVYNTFLRSDRFSGELSFMKKDWMLRLRLYIVSVEQEHKSGVELVQAHEARGGDPKDPTYARAKFLVGEREKERETMAVSVAGGRRRISKFHYGAIKNFLHLSSGKSIVTDLVM